MSQSLRFSMSSSDEELQSTSSPYLRALTSSQRKALEDLKALCAQSKVCWRISQSVATTNDDVTLLRYLRARSWKAPAAFKQYSATVAWRKKIQLDEIYRTADIEHFEAISRVMPQWTGRRSRNGAPLFVYSVAQIQPDDLLRTSTTDPSLSSVFLPAEYSSQFVQPLCARMHPSGSMPYLMHIIDLSGVGVKHFWSLRSHLQKAAGMATSHYPESVDKIFIVGAPSFFPTIWGYITKWFDPAIVSKIQVLSTAKALGVLTDHVHLDDLPKSFGGRLDWNYGMQPVVDEETRALLGDFADDWPEGPLQYLTSFDNREENGAGNSVVAVGSQHGKKLRKIPLMRWASSRRSSDQCLVSPIA